MNINEAYLPDFLTHTHYSSLAQSADVVDLDPSVMLSVLFTGRKAAKMKYDQLVLLWILFKQKASQVHKSCMIQFTRET